jgi:hypothetical protein
MSRELLQRVLDDSWIGPDLHRDIRAELAKPEPIDHRTVTMRGGVVASVTHVNYLPDDGVYKLYAVRIDDGNI